MCSEDPSNDILVDADSKRFVDLLRDPLSFTFYFPDWCVLVLQEDALTFIAECPVQITFHITGCRSIGIHIKRAANGIRTLSNASDTGYQTRFVGIFRNAGNLNMNGTDLRFYGCP